LGPVPEKWGIGGRMGAGLGMVFIAKNRGPGVVFWRDFRCESREFRCRDLYGRAGKIFLEKFSEKFLEIFLAREKFLKKICIDPMYLLKIKRHPKIFSRKKIYGAS
jgi:hypothetical protein